MTMPTAAAPTGSTLSLTRSEERAFEADAAEYVRVQTRRYPPTTLDRQMGHMDVAMMGLGDAETRKPIAVDAEAVRRAQKMLDRMDHALPTLMLMFLFSLMPTIYAALHLCNLPLATALLVLPAAVIAAILATGVWAVVKESTYRRTVEAAALAAHPYVSLPGGVAEAVEDHREALQKVRLSTREPQVLVAAAEFEQDMERLLSKAPRMGHLWGENDTFDVDVYRAYYTALTPFTEQVYALAGQASALASLVEQSA